MKYVTHWHSHKGWILQFHVDDAICDSFETFESEELLLKFVSENGLEIVVIQEDENVNANSH